jgi:hypothetical protein
VEQIELLVTVREGDSATFRSSSGSGILRWMDDDPAVDRELPGDCQGAEIALVDEADVTARVRERWQSGDRDGAAALVTDEMILATTLIGTEDMDRARLEMLSRGIDLVRSVG